MMDRWVKDQGSVVMGHGAIGLVRSAPSADRTVPHPLERLTTQSSERQSKKKNSLGAFATKLIF
jgi:hypothetical protein